MYAIGNTYICLQNLDVAIIESCKLSETTFIINHGIHTFDLFLILVVGLLLPFITEYMVSRRCVSLNRQFTYIFPSHYIVASVR